MTGLCEQCQARLGELLQWEIEHPATTSLAADASTAPPSHVVARLAPGSPLPNAPSMEPQGESESEPTPATPEELRELWQHAQSCEDCRRDLALLRSARQVLAELPTLAPPSDLRARIRTELALNAAATAAQPSLISSSAVTPEVRAPGVRQPRPRWNFWSPPSAANGMAASDTNAAGAGEAPFSLRRTGLPRAVWAGGGAVVAAFCVILALQLQIPSRNPGASEADSVPPAPSSPALDSVKSPQAQAQGTAPGGSTGAASSSKATLGRAVAGKPAAGTPGRAPASASKPAPGAPRASLPSPSKAAPAPNVGSQAPATMPMPNLPPVPSASDVEPRRERPRSAKQGERAQSLREEGKLSASPPTASATHPARPTEEAASIRVQVAPLPPRSKVRVSDAGSATPSAAPSVTSRPGQASTGNNDESPSGMASSSGAAGAASSVAGRAATDSAAPRRSTKVRGGSALEAPASEASPSGSIEPSPADPSSPTVAAPAPAAGGFGVSRSPDAGAGITSNGAEPGTATATTNSRTRSQSAPPKANSRAALDAAQVEAMTRRVTVEVKAARAIRRARVEVVLSEGWLFAEGAGGTSGVGSRRVLWSGRAKAGQVIHVQVELKAARADAPALAARVLLLDVSQAISREVSGADISIPTAPSADSQG